MYENTAFLLLGKRQSKAVPVQIVSGDYYQVILKPALVITVCYDTCLSCFFITWKYVCKIGFSFFYRQQNLILSLI